MKFHRQKSKLQIGLKLTMILAFLLTFQASIFSQFIGLDPEKLITQYTIKTWTIDNGLPSNAITNIIQSKSGYLWITTYGGLAKFDGVNFTNYTTQNSRALLTEAAKVICEDNDGTIWVGTQKGLALIKDRNLYRDKRLEKLDNSNIESIYTDKKNRVWIGTNADGLFKFEADSLMHLKELEKLTTSAIYAIYEDDSSNVWIGTIKGELIKYKNGVFIPCDFNHTSEQIFSFFQDSEGVILVCANSGIYKIDNNKLSKKPLINIKSASNIIEDLSGNMWISSDSEGLYRYNKLTHQIDLLSEQNGLPNNSVTKILFSSHGDIWGCTNRGGLFQITDGKFTCFSTSEGLSSNVNTTILQYDKNEIWVGNEMGTVDIIKNGKISQLKTQIPIPGKQIKHLFKDSKENVWISTYAGLLKIGKQKEKLFTINHGFPDNYIRKIFEDEEGNIWVCTNRTGLHKINSDGSIKTLNTNNGLSSDYVMTIIQYKPDIIIAGTKKGINFIKNDSVINIATMSDGLADNLIFNLYKDEDSIVWIATNSGISRFENNSFTNFTVESGLLTNNVFDILEDNSGYFWLPGATGIMKVAKQDLNDYALGKINKVKSEFYDKGDGMKNSVCLGATQSLKDDKGNLWFLTAGGIARINPTEKVVSKEFPPIFIENVSASDTVFYNVRQTITIHPKFTRFNIKYTAVGLIYPEKILFKYKLEPFENEWVVSETIRNVSYTNLNPGKYVFKVRSTNYTGIWNEDYASVVINVLPAWHQTILFKITLFISFFSAIFIWIRFRLDRIKKQRNYLKKQVEEKTAEVHNQNEELLIINEELTATNEELYNQREELEATLATLKKTQDSLIQSEKMASLGVLSAGIAHEINNPLNFIHGGIAAIELCLGENATNHTQAFKPYIDAVNTGVKRATDIVSSLSHYSRQDDLAFVECDIHSIIDNCLIMLQNHLKDKVEIIKNYPEKRCTILGNEGKLHQVFLNLISNAEQSIEKKGSIKISTQSINNKILVEIKDTGHGILPENISKIFDPFFTTKDQGKGTGLGLSITYTIINEHNGTIEFSSDLNKGTIVKVQFPIYKADKI